MLYAFLLTRPLRDVTKVLSFSVRALCISTHTPLAGRDRYGLLRSLHLLEFLLTRPLRDVTSLNHAHQLTVEISTHTPLAGRDYNYKLGITTDAHFYSHAPCGT